MQRLWLCWGGGTVCRPLSSRMATRLRPYGRLASPVAGAAEPVWIPLMRMCRFFWSTEVMLPSCLGGDTTGTGGPTIPDRLTK